MGDLWVTSAAGAHRYTGLTRVLWQADLPLELAGDAQRREQAALQAVELGATGRLYLEGQIKTAQGQTLAGAQQPFTVYAASAPALSLAVEPRITWPGGGVTLTGALRNGGAEPLVNQVITLTLGDAEIAVLQPDELSPGEVWLFAITASAPEAATGTVWAAADTGVYATRDRLTVDAPALDAGLDLPVIVGRHPFDLALTLQNVSLLEATTVVTVATASDGDAVRTRRLSLAPGERRILLETYTLTADAIFTVTVGAEYTAGADRRTLTHTFVRNVTFGESVVTTLPPERVYPEGPVTIPYTLVNTGQRPVRFTTALTVTDGQTVHPRRRSAPTPRDRRPWMSAASPCWDSTPPVRRIRLPHPSRRR
jgi:hypothetical protein